MIHDLAPLDLSSSNNVILNLVAEFDQDVENLKITLDHLSKLNTEAYSHYIFNGKGSSSTELKSVGEMTAVINRQYWIKFFKQVPLSVITNQQRLKEVEETLRYGEIGLFTYNNIQNLIQQLYIEKFKVNIAMITDTLYKLSALDCAQRTSNTDMLPSVIVIKNMYTASNQAQSELFEQIDVVRRMVKEDMHHPTYMLPLQYLVDHSHRIRSDWISIDTDLFRFRILPSGCVQIALSEMAVNIVAKNTHAIENQILKMEWVIKTYESDFKETARQFDESELVALQSILDHIDSINDDGEIHIPYDKKNEGLVLLSLGFNWAYKILTTGIGQSERCGYHKLKIYKPEIERFIRNVFQGSFTRYKRH